MDCIDILRFYVCSAQKYLYKLNSGYFRKFWHDESAIYLSQLKLVNCKLLRPKVFWTSRSFMAVR